ncbi:MAG: hypothetical protein OSJ52_07710 [Lachnospiraceae bacterium]|nr:hypothetical protein [Lachnospiraceae bacterium]
MLLLCKDIPVLFADRARMDYILFREDLLPWQLKGVFQESPARENCSSYEDYVFEVNRISRKNDELIDRYLAGKVLPLSRANAKKLYSLLSASQSQTVENKAKISLMCHAVTLQDNYWVKAKTDTAAWAQISVRDNPLNEIVTQVALHGTSLSLQGSLTSPEFTTRGAYAKAWRREEGELYLYKAGHVDPTEAVIEAEVSHILDFCNVPHLHYELAELEGTRYCKCKCMASEERSVLHAEEFFIYCNHNGLDFEREVLKLDAENYYKMWIVDYLISNPDRHLENWGFYYDPTTTDILGFHPLYDHNNAFDRSVMENKSAPYIVNGKPMAECARFARKRVDFHFLREPQRSDFRTERHYKSFLSRAKELEIPVKAETPS